MDMQKLMKQAQAMQRDMEKNMAAAQEMLADETVEASAGGGMVTVTATGLGVITKVSIDPDGIDADDIEMLEDMVLAAVNEAHRQAKDLESQRMSAVMPAGMPGMPF